LTYEEISFIASPYKHFFIKYDKKWVIVSPDVKNRLSQTGSIYIC